MEEELEELCVRKQTNWSGVSPDGGAAMQCCTLCTYCRMSSYVTLTFFVVASALMMFENCLNLFLNEAACSVLLLWRSDTCGVDVHLHWKMKGNPTEIRATVLTHHFMLSIFSKMI